MYESPFEIAKMVVDLQILNTLRNDEASLVGEFKFVLMTAYISDRESYLLYLACCQVLIVKLDLIGV